MACIQSDGTLSDSALIILRSLDEAEPSETIARRIGKPLYVVRANLRELGAAGLVAETGGRFEVTSSGRLRARAAGSAEASETTETALAARS